MGYPSSYSRRYGFQGFQDSHPTTPLPGDQVDAELAAVGASTAAIIAFLRQFARSDGKIANNSIGVDQLAADLSIGFKAPTTWESGVNYLVADTVFYGNKFYNCETAHLSGDTFASEYWTVIVDFGAQATAAAASATAAATSETNAAASESAAAASETAAATSETNAAASESAAAASATAAATSETNAAASESAAATSEANAAASETAAAAAVVVSGVFLSQYASLALADAAAALVGKALVIDTDVTLTSSFTSAAPQIRFHGGVIATGTYTADLTAGTVHGSTERLFDVSGGGLVKFRKGQHIQDAWFGVAPDGSSDDAPALATLYTQLASSQGCTVHHRSGVRYRLESTKIRIPSNTRVAGNGAIFEIRNGYFNRGILIDGVTDVQVADLFVEMKATTAAAQYYGIAVQNSSRVHLLRCKAIDPSWSDSTDNASIAVLMYGFLCGQSTTLSLASGAYAGDGSDDTACDDITWEDCEANGCYQYGFEDFPKRISYRHRFIRCIARNVGNSHSESLAPAGFKPGQMSYGTEVTDCIAEDCWYGIIPLNYCSLNINNFTCRNPRRGGVAITLAEHSYFSFTTGGNAGTGYYTDLSGVSPYTLEYLRVNGRIYHTSDKLTGSASTKTAVLLNGSITRNGRILFDDMDIDVTTGWNGYMTDSSLTASIPGVEIRGGRCKAKNPTYFSNDGSAVLNAPKADKVVFETNDTTASDHNCRFYGTGAVLKKCDFIGMTTYGVLLSGASSMVLDCGFINLNPGSVATTVAVYVVDSGNTYTLAGVKIIGGNVAAVVDASASGVSVAQWHVAANSNIKMRNSSNVTLVDGQFVTLGGAGNGSRLFTGTAAPTTGAYTQGDIVLNRNISAGGTFGWECTSSGSPGTWKAIVSIAA